MSNNNHSAGDELVRAGQRIQELVEKISAMPDPASRAMLQETLESVLGFYGHGLERILQLIEKAGPDGEKVHRALIEDPGVRGLLLIHGLHPVSLEDRLVEALDKVRPYMESHGGNVELLGIENDFARLKLVGHCQTCPSSTVTLELAVRAAIEEACPDLAGFEVEGMPKPAENGSDEKFQHTPAAAPEWTRVDAARDIAEGTFVSVHEGAEALLLCKSSGQLYAYRDHCPACNLPLHLGSLAGGILTCSLGHRFDVRHAGESADKRNLHLDPLPLLVQDTIVKVAIPCAENFRATSDSSK